MPFSPYICHCLQVYPKFDRLAKVWKEMEEDLAQVLSPLHNRDAGVLITEMQEAPSGGDKGGAGCWDEDLHIMVMV